MTDIERATFDLCVQLAASGIATIIASVAWCWWSDWQDRRNEG